MGPIPVDYIKKGKTGEADLRIVEVLEKDKKNAYDTDEIAKILGLNPQSIRQALSRLTETKRVNRERVGRKYYYFAK